MRAIQLTVTSITVKEENVIQHNLPVGQDVKKAGGETYSSSSGLSRCQRKEKRNSWAVD